MSHDSLEREIVEKLIEVFTHNYTHMGKDHNRVNSELLKLVAKYRSRLGEDSWMQRQYNKGLEP
tara:strand:- start:267 stop:458 length:192 start_codon:yes stop_codon:yes gene_type:complete